MRENDCPRAASNMAMTRRRFLADSAKCAATASLAAAATSPAARAAETAAKTTRVVIVTHPKALLKPTQADSGVVAKMLEVGMKALTGKQSDKDAWGQIAQPGQRVTIKWNEMGFRPIRVHPEVRLNVGAELARHAGLDPAKVSQFSRTDVKGEPARIVRIPIPGCAKPAKLRKIITDFTDVLINIPVLKTHSGQGISMALKNHFGSIANPSDFHSWGRGNMGKNIVELNMHPSIKDTTRLVIVDALRPQWDGGPLHKPGCRWDMNALIFGLDPIAVDTVGADLLEEKRKSIGRLKRKWQLRHAREMLAYGQEKGLGIADSARIEVKRIELKA